MPSPGPGIDPAPYLEQVRAPDGVLTVASPPGTLDGGALHWPAGAPSFGTAAPRWDGA